VYVAPCASIAVNSGAGRPMNNDVARAASSRVAASAGTACVGSSVGFASEFAGGADASTTGGRGGVTGAGSAQAASTPSGPTIHAFTRMRTLRRTTRPKRPGLQKTRPEPGRTRTPAV
jgi:hypothetical protein